MTQLRRQLAQMVIYPVVAGVMAGATLYGLNTANVATATLAEERRALDAEHAVNERQHEASRKDRDELRKQLQANRAVIDNLLGEIRAMKDAAAAAGFEVGTKSK